MARHAFFSFHFGRDHWRVSQVRNSWVVRGEHEAQPFFDSAGWEAIKRKGDVAIKNWIDSNLAGKSVTVVLIGAETASRRWVRYEMQQTHTAGRGMVGIYINGMKDQDGRTDYYAPNPFDALTYQERDPLRALWGFQTDLVTKKYSEKYRTYDWIYNDGRKNISQWIEEAAINAGR